MLLSAGIERVHIWKAASGVRLPETEGGQSARENGNPCSPTLPVGAHCLVRRRSYLSLVLEGLSRDSRSLWAYLEARSAGSAGPGTEASCPGLPGCPTAPRPPPPSRAAWPAPGRPPTCSLRPSLPTVPAGSALRTHFPGLFAGVSSLLRRAL